MQFANPIWLAGLAGILVPLAIHLLSRKEGKVIRIGSIRHFEETSTRQFKSVKLNEILLLALRSLLILFMVSVLAGLQWPGDSSGETKWILIEKGLEHDKDIEKVIERFTDAGFEKRALANGFPVVSDSIYAPAFNYWQLMESLHKERLDSIVIISASRVNGFKGERKTLPPNVLWISRTLPKNEKVIQEVKLGGDSVWVRKGVFGSDDTEFISETVSNSPSATSPDTVHVVVVSDKSTAYDAQLLVTSLKAIDQNVPHVIIISQVDRASFQEDKRIDWTFWLAQEKIPAGMQNVVALTPRPSENLIEVIGATQWLITRRLTPENVVEQNLTLQLAQVLLPEKEIWSKANELDIRSGDSRFVETNTSPLETEQATTYSGQTLWVVLIALTFLSERIVSYRRMQ